MPAGRPPMFDNPEDLQALISEYFEEPPMRPVKTKDGVEYLPAITITGLALHCGFESRQSFYDYEQKPEFAYTIKRARAMIEQHYENHLLNGSPAGAIFALKNFGWKDTHTNEHQALNADGERTNWTVKFINADMVKNNDTDVE